MSNLTIRKELVPSAWNKDKRFKPFSKSKPHLSTTYIDITSLAIRKQHNPRYLILGKTPNGKLIKLDIDIIVSFDIKTRKGYYAFVPHNPKKALIRKFLEKTNITLFNHDKGFIFKGLGIAYYSTRHKQKIEHIFSFKRWIYRKHKAKPFKANELFNEYRRYFNNKGFKEITL